MTPVSEFSRTEKSRHLIGPNRWLPKRPFLYPRGRLPRIQQVAGFIFCWEDNLGA